MAAVAGAHGVLGEVRLKLFTASPESLKQHLRFGVDGRSLTLVSVRPGPQGAVARFAEVRDRTAAEGLRGMLLTVPRDSLPALPEGEYYWHDLVDLPVVDEGGEALGRVVGVENFGASDLLDVELADGRRVLVPLVPDAVHEVGSVVRVGRDWIAAA